MKRVPTVVETNTFNLLKWLWALKEETDRVIVTLNQWEKGFDVYIDVHCYSELKDDTFKRYTRVFIRLLPDGYVIDTDSGFASWRCDLNKVKEYIVQSISDDTENYEYTIDLL